MGDYRVRPVLGPRALPSGRVPCAAFATVCVREGRVGVGRCQDEMSCIMDVHPE
jgi:hypothetical protein